MSIPTSVTWFNPVMNRFMNSDGTRAAKREERNFGVRHMDCGTANMYRLTIDKQDPIMVWGLVKSHTASTVDQTELWSLLATSFPAGAAFSHVFDEAVGWQLGCDGLARDINGAVRAG